MQRRRQLSESPRAHHLQPKSKRYRHLDSPVIGENDDKDGYLVTFKGMQLSPKYVANENIGQGTYGIVVKAFDTKSKLNVAIKIIRAVPKYIDAAYKELQILRKIKRNDTENKYRCIHLLDYFVFQNHDCFVFNLLDKSLYDYMESIKFAPLSLKEIQSLADQMLMSIRFLHKLNIIHTDLKPENLMLESGETIEVQFAKRTRKVLKRTDLQLIDFGSAVQRGDRRSSIVSTRHYRAPEVILDLGWSEEIDIWSIGCILVELYIGIPLFQTHEDAEHLRLMEVILGDIPRELSVKCKRDYFRDGKVRYPSADTPASSESYVKSACRLEVRSFNKKWIVPRNDFERDFYDFIRGLLEFIPERRLTAREAYYHPFLSR